MQMNDQQRRYKSEGCGFESHLHYSSHENCFNYLCFGNSSYLWAMRAVVTVVFPVNVDVLFERMNLKRATENATVSRSQKWGPGSLHRAASEEVWIPTHSLDVHGLVEVVAGDTTSSLVTSAEPPEYWISIGSKRHLNLSKESGKNETSLKVITRSPLKWLLWSSCSGICTF